MQRLISNEGHWLCKILVLALCKLSPRKPNTVDTKASFSPLFVSSTVFDDETGHMTMELESVESPHMGYDTMPHMDKYSPHFKTVGISATYCIIHTAYSPNLFANGKNN